MQKIKILSLTTGIAIVGSLALSIPVFAATSSTTGTRIDNSAELKLIERNRGSEVTEKGIMGTVSAINGSTITVSVLHRPVPTSTSTVSTNYSVDISSAKIRKGVATSTISEIKVGERVVVQGVVTGTNVKAKTVIQMGLIGNGASMKKGERRIASSTVPVIGNGEPVIVGNISNISSSTLTVTTASNITYTVDASNSKIQKGPAPISLADLVVGNRIVVQGVANGTSIVASTIVQQPVDVPINRDNNGNDNSNNGNNSKSSYGFFGGIGRFFARMFGF